MTTTVSHFHAWRAGPTAGEVTILRKAGPVFETRKAARVWLRDRRGKLAKVFLCRDDLCPALDLGDDDKEEMLATRESVLGGQQVAGTGRARACM